LHGVIQFGDVCLAEKFVDVYRAAMAGRVFHLTA